MSSRQNIAEQLLSEMLGRGVTLDGGQYCECPGVGRHTTSNGRRDFRVVLDGAPTGFCFHGKCSDEVARFNKELRRRIWFDENGHRSAPSGHWGVSGGEGVAAAPKEEPKTRPEIDKYSLWEFTRGVPEIDPPWMRRRSPMGVENVESGAFLNAIYEPGERVLVFTDQRSQGDFLWAVPAEGGNIAGGFRLSQQRNVKAVPSALPRTAKEGIWFLSQPVTGQWIVKRDVTWDAEAPVGERRDVKANYTRRSQGNATAWRYYVLESDELDAATWLKVLVNLPLPIAAIYTSASRSIHGLAKIPVSGKAEWDAVMKNLRQLVCPVGADPAALTAIRLTRLPGCFREGKSDRAGKYTKFPKPVLQQLLYLNPQADYQPIRLLPEVRE